MRIINGKIITHAGPTIANGFVEFEQGKITGVGDMGKIKPVKGDIDAQGCFVGPGFIDLHTQTGSKYGGRASAAIMPHLSILDDIDLADGDFTLAAQGGITTVIVSPGDDALMGGAAAVVKTLGASGRAQAVSALLQKLSIGETPRGSRPPHTRMAQMDLLGETFHRVQAYQGSGNGGPADVALQALVPLLHGNSIALVNCHRADDILNILDLAAKFSVRIVLVGASESYQVAEEIAAAGCGVAVGPIIMDSDSVETYKRSLRTPLLLHQKGIPVALVSGHPAGKSLSLQYLPALAAFAVREGVPEPEAYKMISLYPAQLAGLDDRVGAITPGKDADLVVFAGNPLDYTQKPEAVFVNGVQVIKGGCPCV